MTLPKWAVTVTPFSKTLALIIFVTFPIIGFGLGMKYQKTVTPSRTEYITKERIIRLPPKDTVLSLIKRCGMIPDEVQINKSHFDVINGPVWSQDCRHISWSLWESGPGYREDKPEVIQEIENNPRQLSGREGVFLYTEATKKTVKIFSPSKLGELPVFKEWLDRNTIVFTANNNEYKYDLKNNFLTLIKKIN